MKITAKTAHAVLAVALVAMSGTALAKDPVESQANQVAKEAERLQKSVAKLDNTVANETAVNQKENSGDRGGVATDSGNRNDDGYNRDVRDRHEDHGNWGLLGLLGLAGLAALRRRDHDHIDRRNHRDTVAGTRAPIDPGTERGTGIGDGPRTRI